MSFIVDQYGNKFQGQIDGIGGETFTDNRTVSTSLGSLNAEQATDIFGKAVINYNLRTGAGNLTVVFEGSIDGTNYDFTPMPAMNLLTESIVTSVVITTTQASTYAVECSGFRRIRARISAFTSGTVTVAGRSSVADFQVYAKPIPTLLWVTSTAAANTSATATLPAAGAGLYHYITSINLMRNATAALAGTATLIHTTTNLTGSPAWSVGNNMIAGGTQVDVDFQPASPLKSTVANTNTTVVMPAAGAAVLNRLNVGYYVGA